MSMCAGKTECEIYRDKKYCRKAEDRMNGYDGICLCNHAILPCQVKYDRCFFSDICKTEDQH